MTIIREILQWSKDLPLWQQDAVRRLYGDRTPSAEDLDDILALAKAEAGIPDPQGRRPQALENAAIAVSPDPARHLVLTAIKDVANVNALANGGNIPISPTGLTIIYGENGAGKSGYSRIFKHACRARDRREPILPNANVTAAANIVPSAVFEVEIDGQQQELPWRYKEASPEALADIAIFDTHCARAYIDNSGDFAYVPYGLDILESLAGICSVVRQRTTNEKNAASPNTSAYDSLVTETTSVGRALIGIPARTKVADIEALASISEAEVTRFALLGKTLAEADPKQKAQMLAQKVWRFDELRQKMDTLLVKLSEERVAELQGLVNKSNAAKTAAEIAATDFRKTPEQLPGTGGEEWKLLFEAARIFSAICHADHQFPALPPDIQCPLCQNELGEQGVQRFGRFDEFIKNAAEKSAKQAREVAGEAYKAIVQISIDVGLNKALLAELTEIDPALASACTTLQENFGARQKAVLSAASNKQSWNEVPQLSPSPLPRLAAVIAELAAQAKVLEASADEKAKAAMQVEWTELHARDRLKQVKTAVLDSIARHELCRKLQSCIDSANTTSISRKSTSLSLTLASQELADALNEELQQLQVHELQVVMKPTTSGGRTQYKLTLQLPGGGTPSAILSEGEQRAIAIASFLAEIKLGNGRGGIVFDDPVSSLDHRRRWEVSERLALESRMRQVIVFTHDIYFLCILEQKAEELGATFTKNYIRRTRDGFGVHSENLPFDVVKTKDRVGQLRQLHVGVVRAHKEGDDDTRRRRTARCYGHLRLAWERAVEEVLFNGVVQRFGEGISTQRLKGVTVTDDDYEEVDSGMTKSSKFEHDAAMATGRLPVPHPDELLADIEKLETWRAKITKRNELLTKDRT